MANRKDWGTGMPVEMRHFAVCSRAVPSEAMLRERKKRRLAAIVCAAVCAVCAALGGAYLLDGANLISRELEGVMGAMLTRVAPLTAVALAALAVHAAYRERSMLREIAAAQAAEKATPAPAAAGRDAAPILRVALYAAAAALVVHGVLNGGMRDVLVKAINICTECIGLG